MINICSFLNLYQSSDFLQDCTSSGFFTPFDGNFDSVLAAFSKIGFEQMPIGIGKVGWPTDGALSANL